MKQDGFTLLELLVVIFILGVVCLLCAPWFGTQIALYRFQNAVGGFKSLVGVAKIRPMGQIAESSGTIFIDRVSSGKDGVTLSVGKDPYNPEKPTEHKLEKDKPYFVTLTGLNPQNTKQGFPWSLNDRMYECSAPDNRTLKCKSGGLNVNLDPNPMPLGSNGMARIATTMLITGLTEKPADPEAKEIMTGGEYFRVRDKGSLIEYQYNKDNMRVVFIETDDKGARKETDCGTTPCKIIFDHSGFTRDSATYEIRFHHFASDRNITQKILPSGAIQ